MRFEYDCVCIINEHGISVLKSMEVIMAYVEPSRHPLNEAHLVMAFSNASALNDKDIILVAYPLWQSF